MSATASDVCELWHFFGGMATDSLMGRDIDDSERPVHHGIAARPNAMAWLLASLGLVILPHAARLPVWVTLAALALGMWRLLHDRRGWPLPGRGLRAVLALGALAAITVTFGTPTGRGPGIAFLIILLGLKLTELRGGRDVMLTAFLGYFVVITNFLYSQSVPLAVYMVIVVLAMTTALLNFSQVTDIYSQRVLTNVRMAAMLLLQALPIAVLLFLFFPRVSGPLWGLPNDAYGGLTGLTEKMTPGRISQLSQSTEVAFRVTFADRVPPPSLRYWRGPVLWDYDGYTWTPGTGPLGGPTHLQAGTEPVHYTVTLEPHDKTWLFVLDLPVAIVGRGVNIELDHAGPVAGIGAFTADYQLRAAAPVRARRQYTVLSYTTYHAEAMQETMRRRGLQLPEGISDRVIGLARQWRRTTRSDGELIARALSFFAEEPFVYTLRPPPLGDDPTGEFLFETRRGYCEHFASSFTILMRAAGIPARVVTGYQGGELNPLGDYLLVRQLDAHAWSEVWLDGEGWTRVDPTGAVAPARIEMGMEALEEFSALPGVVGQSVWLAPAWHGLRLGLDTLNNFWNQWVLSYTPARQRGLLTALGLDGSSWRTLTSIAAAGIGGLLGFFALTMLRGRRRMDPVQKAFDRFCRKLARKGMRRDHSEGPLDYAARVGVQRPELRFEAESIAMLYAEARYGPSNPTAQQLDRLKRAVRTFKP